MSRAADGRAAGTARAARAIVALRSVVGSGGLIVRRRARRDAWLVLAVAALIATSTLLAVAGPRLVLGTVDSGAREAVRAAGPRADIVLTSAVGDGATLSTASVRVARTDLFLELGQDLHARLPQALQDVYAGTTTTILGPPTNLVTRDDVPDRSTDADGDVDIQIGLLPQDGDPGLTIIDGAMPAARTPAQAGAPVEVVVSRAGAQAAALEIGMVLTVDTQAAWIPRTDDGPAVPSVDLLVVGLVGPADTPGGAAVAGADPMPEVLAPVFTPERSNRAAFTRLTVLAAPDGITAASGSLGSAFAGTVRVHVDPTSFTNQVATQVTDAVGSLASSTAELTGGSGASLTVVTRLDEVLQAYPSQARAALAQMSVMIAGVIGVGGVVIVLLSRLLVGRRAATISLERARGSSVVAVGVRLLAESVLVTAGGTALGIVGAGLAVPGEVRDAWPVVVVAAVAVVAAPLQGMWHARGAWTGRREPANRQDRAALRRRRRARRLVAEAAAVLLAAAALLSLRGRGLLQTTTDGVDPFLAAAPLLLAIAVTVVVLRVQPWPVRAAGALGRRSPGVLGLLGAVRAERAVAALPLLALTLGVALAVGGGLLVGTVRDGQVEASWERIGADVRVDAPTSAEVVGDLARQPGVTGVTSADVSRSVTLKLGTSTEIVTVLAIDRSYLEVAEALPTAPAQQVDASGAVVPDGLTALATDVPATDPLPVVVDAALAERLVTDQLAMYYGPNYVELVVVGTTDRTPRGYLDGPFVYIDLSNLDPHTDEAPVADTVLVVGPGADEAAASVGLPTQDVLSRAQWLEARRDLALLSGVEQMMVGAVAAVALLAAVALVATVLGGARERGRALSMLRTLEMNRRLGWWLALAELAPVVVAAVLGGTVAGVTIVVLLAPALGLDVLAGGLGIPDPSISPTVVVALAAGALVLLVLAAGVEVLTHRRDRLSEVLRVGETP
ncbi:hypothetical protein [Cellulomonas sp. KRMCY2]|uniref:hypothetical protein n=1 Tax=Cellulomonas sp. KRMCY2 TaxID=1304865 RepID=UPI00045E7AB8|nr:hypothetical protein [Cellulomonas sp. KRMCY2]